MIPRLYIRDQNDRVVSTLDEGDYFDDNLTRYLAGKASIFEFSIYKSEDDYKRFSAGKKLSFRYEDEDFWMSIVNTDQEETKLTIMAVSLNLELNNEVTGPYKASKAMTFVEYVNAMVNYEKTFEIGLNEVSDKKITNEWTGTSKNLARLFSLANVFDAELEFVTKLNDNGSLKSVVLNVYKAHSDNTQGLGVDHTKETVRFGEEITTISKQEDSNDVYTSIRPKGKDGLTIKDVEHEVFDDNGNLLYATYKTAKPGFDSPFLLYAPQSRDLFPSTLTNDKDRWTNLETDEMDYTSAEALYGYALGQLKQNSVPQVKWEISGYIDARIGDTIRVADDGYKPEIYLDARITEQEISFTNPTRNKSTFSNVIEKQSGLSAEMLKAVEYLKKSVRHITSTVVDYQIGDAGPIAPTGEWTIDKPIVKPGDYLWTRTTQKMSDGTSIIGYSIGYIGTNGAKGDNGLPAYVHNAWSWSADGTDRFTTVYPGENIFNHLAYYEPNLIWNRELGCYENITQNVNFAMFDVGKVITDLSKTYTMSFEIEALNDTIQFANSLFYLNSTTSVQHNKPILIKDKKVKVFATFKLTTTLNTLMHTYYNEPPQGAFRIYNVKFEVGSTPTIYTPSPLEDPVNAYPHYMGTYSDNSPTASTNPADYTWVRTLGEAGQDGKDGIAGKDGNGIKATAVSYQASTNGTTPPTGTWSASVPTVAKGSYLWTRTIWTYTDNTTETGYAVAYMGTNGNNGANGVAGKDGVGIKTTTITYASSTSGTTAPTSGWVATPPTATAGQFVWTRTIWTYTDNTTETGYSVGKIGEKGATGDKGATGPAGAKGDKGDTGATGPTGPKGDQGIMGVAYLQPTKPATTQQGATWFKTVSTTDHNVTGIYSLIGTAWTQTPVTAEALAVTSLSALSANLGKVTAGELDGVLIIGAEFSNPYDFTDAEQNHLQGTLTIKDSEITNIGTVNKGSATDEHNFIVTDAPLYKSAQIFKGLGQEEWEKAYNLSVDGLSLQNKELSQYGTVNLGYQDLITVRSTAITANPSQFVAYDSGTNAPLASRQGRIVQIKGAFKPVVSIPKANAQNEYLMGILPVWARPKDYINFLAQASGTNIYLCVVNTNGQITMSRYRNGGAYTDLAVGVWLNIATAYAAGDIV